MFQSIRRWLEDIRLANSIERQHATIIQFMFLGLIAAAFAWLPISLSAFTSATGRALTISSSILVVAFTVIALVMLRRGRFGVAVLLASTGLLLAATIVLLITGLPNSGGLLFVLSSPIVLVGLLVGRRGLIVFVALSLLIVAGIALAEDQMPRLFHSGSLDAPLSILGTFGLALLMLGLFVDQFGVTLHHALRAALEREQELQETRSSLEQMVVERTSDLRTALEEARQASEAAEDASRAKSEFLSRMSHELRTPLNGILGFGQILSMYDLSPDQHKSVAAILKSGHHLLNLINEILDIARIEAGHLSLSIEPVPLQLVIDEVLEIVAPLASPRQIKLANETVATCGTGEVLADYQRIKQVLINFISNAIKYNRDEGEVTIECEELPLQGRLRITVRDTGLGIPEAKLSQLFTPFSRLGQEQGKIEGVGLGLALTKHLVEAMNGEVGASSVMGQGSSFWLTLPRVDAQVSPSGEDEAALSGELPGHGQTVLYIEDNLTNVTLIEEMLRLRSGVRLITAIDGTEGVALAQAEQPDMILLDLHLPDNPGDEVLRRLRSDPRTEKIPIVVLSADATQGQLRKLMAAGAEAYLTKPIDIKEFLNVLQATLERR